MIDNMEQKICDGGYPLKDFAQDVQKLNDATLKTEFGKKEPIKGYTIHKNYRYISYELHVSVHTFSFYY